MRFYLDSVFIYSLNYLYHSVKLENLKNSLAAIRHARWFEENAYQSSIRILVRILKDFKKRIPFFKNVSPWTIDLLVSGFSCTNFL